MQVKQTNTSHKIYLSPCQQMHYSTQKKENTQHKTIIAAAAVQVNTGNRVEYKPAEYNTAQITKAHWLLKGAHVH